MELFIKNNHIQLVYTEVSHLPFVLEAEQMEENAKFVGSWTYEQHKEAIEDTDVLHLLIKNKSNQVVGYVIIRGLENKSDNMELMRIVITEKGQGHGQQVIELIKYWCFQIKQANRLWLDFIAYNTRGQHIYEKLGFVREGVLREADKKDGTYYNMVIMSILAREYFGNKLGIGTGSIGIL